MRAVGTAELTRLTRRLTRSDLHPRLAKPRTLLLIPFMALFTRDAHTLVSANT